MSAHNLQYKGEDLLLRLVLQPKSSRDQFVGMLGDELKVAITAPPVDGKANAHLIKFLSKQFKVAKGAISVEKRYTKCIKEVILYCVGKMNANKA